MTRPKYTKRNPPNVDWWECDECQFLFTTYAGQTEKDDCAECPRCDEPGILVLEDVKLA